MFQLVWQATPHKTQRTFPRDVGHWRLLCPILPAPWKVSTSTSKHQQCPASAYRRFRKSLFNEFGNISQNVWGEMGRGDGTRHVTSLLLYTSRVWEHGKWPGDCRHWMPSWAFLLRNAAGGGRCVATTPVVQDQQLLWDSHCLSDPAVLWPHLQHRSLACSEGLVWVECSFSVGLLLEKCCGRSKGHIYYGTFT